MPSAGSGPAPTPPAATSSKPIASPATDAVPAGTIEIRHRPAERRHLERRVRIAAAFASDLGGYGQRAVGAVVGSAPGTTGSRLESSSSCMPIRRANRTPHARSRCAIVAAHASWEGARSGFRVRGSGFAVRDADPGFLRPGACRDGMFAEKDGHQPHGRRPVLDRRAFSPRQRSRIRPARRAVHVEDGRDAPRRSAVASRAC